MKFVKTLIKTLMLIAFVLGMQSSFSQYRNEWINHSRTYYKIKIGKNGFYRISHSTLVSGGMTSINGAQLTLYKDGTKVPIFVSTNGAFSSSDFIEFIGELPNGQLDTELFNNPNWHATDRYSLFTDSSVYYLVQETGTHPRITNEAFTLPTSLPTAEPYMMTEVTSSNGIRPNNHSPGESISAANAVQRSSFDRAEGYHLGINTPPSTSPTSISYSLPIQKLYTGESIPSFINLAMSSMHHLTSRLRLNFNGTALKDTTLYARNNIKRTFNIPSTLLAATNNLSARDTTGRVAANFWSIEYPRTFNYSGITNTFTSFKLNASVGSKYLNFADVTSATGAILYDITRQKRYVADVEGSNARYYIPGHGTRRNFAFTNVNDINIVTSISSIIFKNFSSSSYQGDYLILTNSAFIDATGDPVGAYANYRRSAAGGNYNVKVINVEELYDQFSYGVDMHPLGIKNMLKLAKDTWTTPPSHIFIIGKGILYNQYKTYYENIGSYEFTTPIPTFGNPGSDNLLVDFDNNSTPDIAIGRLSAWNATEIVNYLQKVKDYEANLKPAAIPNPENTLWKKSALHIAGGSITEQSSFINPALNQCTNIYTDSMIGGFVTNIRKNTSGLVPIETDDQKIKNLLNPETGTGINRLTFYGHAFSTGFDYNLNDPDVLISSPRFPNFLAMGCNVSQIYLFSKTIGEKYINSINGGAVSMIASNSLGYPNYLTPYMVNFYKQLSYINHGKTVGQQFMENINSVPGSMGDPYYTMHIQNIIFQGDPALITYHPEKADFYTDDNLIKSSINPIHTGVDSTEITTVIYNLGMAIRDSVLITLEHHKPNGTILYYSDSLKVKINNLDTFKFMVGFDNRQDIGLNKILVKVNPANEIEEISYAQNIATLNLFMSADMLIPSFPYNFSIVHQTPLTLRATSLNLLATNQNYIFQIDTTEKFNSSFLKEQKYTNRIGGLVDWTPPITMKDSTVYYWRTAIGDIVTDSTNWSYSSFIYLENGFDGWNQSHFFQYDKNKPYVNLELTESNRNFKYGNIANDVVVLNRIYSAENPLLLEIRTLINNTEVDKMGCNQNGTIKFILIDSETAQPVPNTGAQYGSIAPCISGGRNIRQFEYPIYTASGRKRAADFIDSIPDGHYVIVSNLIWDNTGTFNSNSLFPNWAGDAAIHGDENTLEYKLKSIGLNDIDSFNKKRVFIHVTKKNDPSFENITKFSHDLEELITVEFNVFSKAEFGQMNSVKIGPSSKWQAALWDYTHPSGIPENDSNTLIIYGLDALNNKTTLLTTLEKSIDLSSISASTYPYLELEWKSKDSITKTPSNLKYWRVLHTPLPEGTLNPNRFYTKSIDTILEGQMLNFEMAFDNISNIQFDDSLLVNYTLIKQDGTSEIIKVEKINRLGAYDSSTIKLQFDPRNYPGLNTLFVEVNPEPNQIPEQFHPNNIAYINFYLQKDSTNPILDVTFDGIHILDRDLVSAKPFIKILLKDENKHIPLSDTSLMTVKLLRPGSTTPEDVVIDGNIAKFNPASTSGKNEASIDFKPNLTKDGLYKLIVSGKDNTNNSAGGNNPLYEIQFMVENKPTITNLLNYPNPFSTSTQFVFTLTGSQVPEQFKIQIMTVTGKVVKEITKQELGTIRIGRNITDYRWDGRDQFGQLLGNGVYIYRLVTGLNGKTVEHRENKQIDQFFNKDGYGKLYIMR